MSLLFDSVRSLSTTYSPPTPPTRNRLRVLLPHTGSLYRTDGNSTPPSTMYLYSILALSVSVQRTTSVMNPSGCRRPSFPAGVRFRRPSTRPHEGSDLSSPEPSHIFYPPCQDRCILFLWPLSSSVLTCTGQVSSLGWTLAWYSYRDSLLPFTPVQLLDLKSFFP